MLLFSVELEVNGNTRHHSVILQYHTCAGEIITEDKQAARAAQRTFFGAQSLTKGYALLALEWWLPWKATSGRIEKYFLKVQTWMEVMHDLRLATGDLPRVTSKRKKKLNPLVRVWTRKWKFFVCDVLVYRYSSSHWAFMARLWRQRALMDIQARWIACVHWLLLRDSRMSSLKCLSYRLFSSRHYKCTRHRVIEEKNSAVLLKPKDGLSWRHWRWEAIPQDSDTNAVPEPKKIGTWKAIDIP